MAQASKAILPRDSGGPWGKRVGVSVGGTLGSGLRVSAFVTGRANPNDWERYSLVVLNCKLSLVNQLINAEIAVVYLLPLGNDHTSSGSWNPVPVKTTIEFRGTQVSYLGNIYYPSSLTFVRLGGYNHLPCGRVNAVVRNTHRSITAQGDTD